MITSTTCTFSERAHFKYPTLRCRNFRDWSLIMGMGGATKWENRGLETFCAPPPSRQGKTFCAPPPFKRWKHFARLPPSPWLKLQASVLKLPQNVCAPPSAWLKLFMPPPLPFRRGKTSHAPILPLCSPPTPSP